MIERLISFASTQGDDYGAIAIDASGESCALVTIAGSTLALDECTATPGEGTLRVSGAGGTLFAGLVAGTSPIGFEADGGLSVQVQAISVSGELDRGAGREAGSGEGLEAVGVSWKLESAAGVGALRTIWAAADERLLVGFAARPEGAGDHAAEQTGFATIRSDGSVEAYEEPLLSTEYDASGAHTRATLELWPAGGELPADRGAGTRSGGGTARFGEGALSAARFDWRLGGVPAPGGYEIFTA
jgi:hypothetical protein